MKDWDKDVTANRSLDWDPKYQYPKEYEGLPVNIEVPQIYKCQITHTIMVNPVVADDFKIYEKEAIEAYFEKHKNATRSPFNIAITTTNVEPCNALKKKIQEWYQQNKSKVGTTSTMAATAKPAAEGPAIKIASGVVTEEAIVASKNTYTGNKPLKAPAARTAQAQARMATPANTTPTVLELFQQNYYGKSLQQRILSQVSNFQMIFQHSSLLLYTFTI